MTATPSPCQGCKERRITTREGEDGKPQAVSCHGSCERYAQYRAYREEISARRKAAQMERDAVFAAGLENIMADRKRYAKQRGRRYSR